MSRLFSEAVALDRSARNGYLDDACRNDSALRVAVDSLLSAHDEAGSFGEAPVFAFPATVKRLLPGTELGQFRIDTLLGAGGMGEVYRAHDSKLRRAVAIKVLPDSFADDPDRRRRFEEEARVLAALNHPHIGAIYGVHETPEVTALILELVEGVTLEERLASGALSIDEILTIARQLAEGLEAAHERGIVHRDFKPGNIKITPDGTVKILDFGLAKIDGSPIGGLAGGSPSGSPHATQGGAVMGTAGYMSPEQGRGQPVDKRTDIWAFGCVLFRMCAQQPPSARYSVTGLRGAVIADEPDWDLLPASTPPCLVRILRRCLIKDPRFRLRDIGEARIAIETGDGAPAVVPRRSLRGDVARVAVASSLVLATMLGILLYRTSSTVGPPLVPVTFPVPPPEGSSFYINPGQTFFAMSPTGSRLAFLASSASDPSDPSAPRRIWVRAMAELEAKPLKGTDGAISPFWSPDGRSLAFLAPSKLKQIDVESGSAFEVCDLPLASMHGTWGEPNPADPEWPGGVILLGSTMGTAIFAVPAAGGTPREIVTADPSKGETRVHWPWFLPDGKRFLYTVGLKNGGGELRLGQLDGTTQTLIAASSNAQWIDPDIVVFVREGALMGQRVDLKAGKPVDEPFSIADQVEFFLTTSRATFSASRTGTIAYHAGGDLKELLWVDRNGKEGERINKPADYHDVTRLSQNGEVLLTARRQRGPGTYDIYQHDLIRGMEDKLTSGRGTEQTPVWIEGGRAIAFSGDSPGTIPHLFRKDLTTGEETAIRPPGVQQLVLDVLPNGDILYAERDKGFRPYRLPLTPGASPALLLPADFNSYEMRVSRDGRAFAFIRQTTGGGRDLYVASLPVNGDAHSVATNVSSAPRWGVKGLYYVQRERSLMTIPVRTSRSVSVGTPQKLFELRRPASLAEVSHDGRFLLLAWLARAAEKPIIVHTAAVRSGRQ